MAGWREVSGSSRLARAAAEMAFGMAERRLLANSLAAWMDCTWQQEGSTSTGGGWAFRSVVAREAQAEVQRQQRLMQNSVAALLSMVESSRILKQQERRSVVLLQLHDAICPLPPCSKYPQGGDLASPADTTEGPLCPFWCCAISQRSIRNGCKIVGPSPLDSGWKGHEALAGDPHASLLSSDEFPVMCYDRWHDESLRMS